MKEFIITIMFVTAVFAGCKQSKWEEIKVKPESSSGLNYEYLDWSGKADSCTYVLINQFMNKEKGTFWATPFDVNNNSNNIYWQQAHAIDVLIYSYERIKDSNPDKAAEYENYFELWYENKANNYESGGSTGFSNTFTDDMCWICLSLIHMYEATMDDKYINTAKEIYDGEIKLREITDDKGTGLKWKSNDDKRNACTNSPGCLVAIKLYREFKEQKYLDDAITLYEYVANNLLSEDGRVEEPPLSYTQGTFGEACRQLFHMTGERKYMRKADLVINYSITSDRCLTNGILRDEGKSMDQSIFKAVLIPYAVNLALDNDAFYTTKERLVLFLEKQAETLWENLDKSAFPKMYCNYYWGDVFPSGDVASMGAQVSGASLMENVVRLKTELVEDE